VSAPLFLSLCCHSSFLIPCLYDVWFVCLLVGVATLGPPADDPFSRIVHKAHESMGAGDNVGHDDENTDELKLTLYRNGTPKRI
jgi:hypothetical protein